MNTESLHSSHMPAATPAPAQQVSKLQDLHSPYFVQQVQVGSELANRPRIDVFRDLCSGRRVLHVGCVDWPITDVGNSLHVALDGICAQLDGFDVHAEAFGSLRPHVRGRLFSDWKDITDDYDIVLVPEVLEHVGDVASFLGQLDSLHAPHVILTVPDAYSCARRHFDYNREQEVFVEVVHPDHNCWYTPYTLASVLSKYTNWKLDGMWFFNGISLLAILTKPTSAK